MSRIGKKIKQVSIFVALPVGLRICYVYHLQSGKIPALQTTHKNKVSSVGN